MQRLSGKWRLSTALILVSADQLFAGECLARPDERVYALPVRAITQKLEAVDHLQSGNFNIKDGRNSIPICGVTHERQPISVGIMFDISGSMRGEVSNLVPIAQIAVGELLATSAPADEYFLELINDCPVMWCRFGAMRSGFERAWRNGGRVKRL